MCPGALINQLKLVARRIIARAERAACIYANFRREYLLTLLMDCRRYRPVTCPRAIYYYDESDTEARIVSLFLSLDEKISINICTESRERDR